MIDYLHPDFILIAMAINIVVVELVKPYTKNLNISAVAQNNLLRILVFVFSAIITILVYYQGVIDSKINIVYQTLIVGALSLIIYHLGIWKIVEGIKKKMLR